MKRALVASLLALGCAGAPRAPALPQSSVGAPEWVVLVSVAGLTADALGAMPTLRALAEAGASAERVEGVAPAATYPAHATLLTGVPPFAHGVVADHRLGERGVRDVRYAHASHLAAATLWQRVLEAGGPVASLAWPTTLGANVPLLLPDLPSERPGQSYAQRLRADATPALGERLLLHGGDGPDTELPGPSRDAALAGVACDLLRAEPAPRLLLVRFEQTDAPLAHHGAASPEAASAFASVDGEIARLLDCLSRAGRLAAAAVVVVGDHGVAPVHTVVAPNAELRRAGLLEVDDIGVVRWSAIARSNGGSAFVYARDAGSAVAARKALEAAARDSGAFRVVPAEEMIALAADAEAWFGIEAEPGFVFRSGATGPLLAPSALRAAGGYLPGRDRMDTAFVAWGRGIRPGVAIPQMRQTDVAPTLARLLGVSLEGAAGRELVGILAVGAVTSGAGEDARDGR